MTLSSDLDELERLATGADAGKWSQLVHNLLGNNFGPFVKAAHPARILELIAEIRRLQKEEQAAVLLADALDTIASITTSPAGDALAEMEPEAMLRAVVECAADALRLWHEVGGQGSIATGNDVNALLQRCWPFVASCVDLDAWEEAETQRARVLMNDLRAAGFGK